MGTNQRKAGEGQAAQEVWKEGFENSLQAWRNAKPADKRKTAISLLAFVSQSGTNLQAFVDNPGIAISEAEADQIRQDMRSTAHP